MEKVRLNKYLSSLGIGSRREIDSLVKNGKIFVNGEMPEVGIKVDDNDEVIVNGKKISNKKLEKVYYLLNKPLDVLSSVKDDRGRKTVVELIETKERIFPIGRLDYKTTGLLILTNDGDLFNRLIHPRSEIYKKYILETSGFINEEKKYALENGISLDDGMTLPAKVNILMASQQKSLLEIFIREGRNRQVRRMMEALGNRVINLKRESLGELSIGNLKEGEYRKLTEKEIRYLYSL
ncbi:pseudouridine synthase [Fusobacterium sp. PH5-44]|uniref:pseudouridine synthase n=1 Tax=unclassified Fusobacterium TaxID=2648384 RepID=UPI003D1C38E0